jgi:hypothetical protein
MRVRGILLFLSLVLSEGKRARGGGGGSEAEIMIETLDI